MNRNEWAKEVRSTIKRKGLTLTKVAHAMNYSEGYVNRVLCGYRSEHVEAALTNLLGVEAIEE